MYDRAISSHRRRRLSTTTYGGKDTRRLAERVMGVSNGDGATENSFIQHENSPRSTILGLYRRRRPPDIRNRVTSERTESVQPIHVSQHFKYFRFP